MKENLHLIALRTVRYSDRSSILSAFTLEHGPMSFVQPAGKGKEAARRRALLMPLGMVECVADIRPGREIHIMGQTRALDPLQGLRSNPVKGTVALFLAEVLGAVLRQAEPDANVWRFVEYSVKALDAVERARMPNFHIAFLMRLAPLLGIEPDTSTFSEGRVFDMIDGTFRLSAPLHGEFVTGDSARLVQALTRINYSNMHLFRFSRQERNSVLDAVLHYYSLHYANMASLKGLDVLRQLF